MEPSEQDHQISQTEAISVQEEQQKSAEEQTQEQTVEQIQAPKETEQQSLVPPLNDPDFTSVDPPFQISDLRELKDIQEEEQKAEEVIERITEDREIINQLYSLHKTRNQLFLQYQLELKNLEKKFEDLYRPIYYERKELVSRNIEGFWLKVFQNHPLGSSYIYKADLPILRYLIDVRVEEHILTDSFNLDFQFNENQYFKNQVLSISFKVDEDDEPEASVGTVIEWTGNNPTVKRVKKRQKSRRGRGQRTVERTEQQESFFLLFQSLKNTGIEDSDDDELFDLEEQFEMCKGIKEDIIPNALMYYLGVKLDDDSGSSGSEEHKKKPKPEGKNKANCEQQ